MTSQETATVEVLTAEVRTLVVGNRQITQSVVKQLDQVLHGDFEPFGRIRTGNFEGWVGRQASTGALVRCFWDPPTPGRVSRELREAEASLERARTDFENMESGLAQVRAEYEGDTDNVYMINSAERRLETARDRLDASVRHWGQEEQWAASCEALWPKYKAWQQLPLIVLAGLR